MDKWKIKALSCAGVIIIVTLTGVLVFEDVVTEFKTNCDKEHGNNNWSLQEVSIKECDALLGQCWECQVLT